MEWTEGQQLAIETRDSDILVSAAAGSGKTAVLVERIIQILLDESKEVNIDQLLVVTFTDAAAEEMRSRVATALEKALTKNPDSYHLRKQVSLIQKASISTLHSFYNQLIRQYAYLLDIDPAFRIIDEIEGDLIKQEVLDDLFEKWYSAEDKERYLEVIDRFSTDRSDVRVEEIILHLYHFAMTNPRPFDWLKSLAKVYDVNEATDESELDWLSLMKKEVIENLKHVQTEIERAKEIANDPSGPEAYIEALVSDELQLISCQEVVANWQELQEQMSSFQFKAFSRKRSDCDEELKERVKQIREGYKKVINDMKETWFVRDLQSHLHDMSILQPIIETLSVMVQQFIEEYTERKKSKAMLDFADIEHLCLEILNEGVDNEGRFIPSVVANRLKNHYYEILVDEYQDINPVQETILQLVRNDSGSGNLYMVGDVKQSIYGFRHADSTLFTNKYDEFSTSDSHGVKIDLSQNFRSRRNILDSTNYIFRQLLDVGVGELAYDQNAELVYGNKVYDEMPYSNEATEIVFVDKDKKHSIQQETDEYFAQLESAQIEARVYIRKINEWLGKQKGGTPLQVSDKDLKVQRDVTYRDIVILQRSKTWTSIIVDEFKKAGIPVYAELDEGYFEAIEIKIMISYLKIIDNPYQDIPLASVLRSPFIRLTEEELAQIRLANEKASFYEALQSYVHFEETNLAKRLVHFLEDLEHFRLRAREGALADLIWEIYSKTGFYDFVGGMPGGRQRTANLRALYDRAIGYEKTSFRGLFRFLRMIERMEEQGKDLGNAPALSEQEDVVRIVSIHKSKGLEFPIVILGGMGREFNKMDLKRDYMTHKDLGFASKFIDTEKRVKYPTLFYHLLSLVNEKEMLAEEMRVLYVAMTRAMEKLVIVAQTNSLERLKAKIENHIDHLDWILPDYERKTALGFLDWLSLSIVRHQDAEVLRDGLPTLHNDVANDPSKWSIQVLHESDLQDELEENQVEQKRIVELVEQWKEIEQTEDLRFVSERLSYEYPYLDATRRRAKQSVSEIKRHKDFRDEYTSSELTNHLKKPIAERPRFLQTEKQFTGAEIGTAMHTIMQHISFEKFPNAVELDQLVDQLIERELLEEELRVELDLEKILKFKDTAIFDKLQTADEIYREVPFNLSIPASEIYGEWNDKNEDHVFLQGIIDCVIKHGDQFTILDYKTDYIPKPVTNSLTQKLVARYEVQLNIYRYAVEKILKQNVDHAYLYFFEQSLLLPVPKTKNLFET